MADNEFAIKITGDASELKDATDAAKEQLDKAGKSVEMLGDLIGVKIPDAITEMLASSELMAPALDAAFAPLAVISLGAAIFEATEKISDLISKTFIYTEEQRLADAQIAESGRIMDSYLAKIQALDEAYEKMGKTASQRTAIDIAALSVMLELAQSKAADLEAKKKKASKPENAEWGETPEEFKERTDSLKVLNEAYDFTSHRIVDLTDKIRNLKKEQDLQSESELKPAVEADLQGRERAEEAAVALERGKWNAIKALVKTSADENESIETAFENKLYEIKTKALNKQLQLALLDPDKNVAEQTAIQLNIEALATEHETALLKIKAQGIAERHRTEDLQTADLKKQTLEILKGLKDENDAVIKAANDQLQIWDESYKGQIEAAKQASEQKIQLITQDREKGNINEQQEIALIAKAKQDELALEVKFHLQREALWSGDLKKVQEIENQIAKAQQQSALAGTKAVTDGLKAQEQQYKQVFSQIGNAFKTNVLSMLEGTETIAQGFQKLYQSLISSLADYIAQKAEKKAEEWAIDKLFHTKSVVAETGAATGKAMTSSFASVMSALPFPANVAAAPGVAAAAGAEATGLGLAGLAAMFELGGIVPQDGLAYLHKDEKIIPASKSGTGAGLDGVGGITVVVNHSVSAVDAASFQGHIRRHGNMIANEVTRALKRKGIGK